MTDQYFNNLKAYVTGLSEKYNLFDIKIIGLSMAPNTLLESYIRQNIFIDEIEKVVLQYGSLFTKREKITLFMMLKNICDSYDNEAYTVLEKYIN